MLIYPELPSRSMFYYSRAQRHFERRRREQPTEDAGRLRLLATRAADEEIAAEKLAELVAERAVWCCI